MKRMTLAVLISGIVVAGTRTADAVGGAVIGNEVLSARALGQGNASVAAQNNDPTTVYTNPAGLTKLLGTQVTVGATYENLNGSYQSSTGVKGDARAVNAIVPNFAYSQSGVEGRWGLGFGVLNPYGLETHWPGDGPLRYIATNSRLRMVALVPSAAYRINRKVSIGAGASYFNLFDATLEKNINVTNINASLPAGLGPLTSGPDALSKLTGSAANWGFQAGVLIEPTEEHSVGVVYHSKVKLNINGSLEIAGLSGRSATAFGGSNYSTGANTDLFLPQNLQFGYAYKPNRRWTYAADLAWYDWTSSDGLDVRLAETNAGLVSVMTNSGNGNPIPQDWHATWNLGAGVNYQMKESLQLRSGFYYQPRATPVSTFTPAVLDLSRYGLTIGAGYQLSSTLTIDAAYNAVFFHSRNVTNNLGVNSTGDPTANFDGKFSNFTNLIAVNLTWRI